MQVYTLQEEWWMVRICTLVYILLCSTYTYTCVGTYIVGECTYVNVEMLQCWTSCQEKTQTPNVILKVRLVVRPPPAPMYLILELNVPWLGYMYSVCTYMYTYMYTYVHVHMHKVAVETCTFTWHSLTII